MGNLINPGSFGECLLRLRRSRNLSQKNVSILAGMDQSYVAGLEAGRRSPPKEKQLRRLIQALEASPKEEQALRTAHALSKLAGATAGLSSEQGQALAALTRHLQHLSSDDIKTVEAMASALANRQMPKTELGEFL